MTGSCLLANSPTVLPAHASPLPSPPTLAPQLHLHGHWFWVMAQGRPNEGTWNPSIPLNPTPVLRDTATVNAGSYLVLRFVASNRGVWIFHCEQKEGRVWMCCRGSEWDA